MPVARPSWCSSVAQLGPTLVIAPHGGLCTRDLLAAETAGTLRGNDLHTAEVARLLAERLDASLIANVAVDRNELDLNRISEVAATAPWFLDLMHEMIERILERHPVAQVLVVHGWHVIQPRCDVGVGARLARADEVHAAAPRLTVSPDFVLGALEALRVAGEQHGIRTTYGERWPAAHRNNVLQLFRQTRPAVAGSALHPLGRLAASGRVQAVQLELGVPLRWPGRWRERFLDSASAAFAVPVRRGVTSTGASAPGLATAVDAMTPGAPSRPRGSALQAYDEHVGDRGLGIVVGMAAMSRDEIGARLLLLPGGQRMLLFTGHERLGRGAGNRVGGLEVVPGDGSLAVHFRGPVLDVPDASRYFRHEGAQLDAALVDLELTLQFTASSGNPFGCVHGRAQVGDVAWDVATHGFTDPVLARPAAGAADGWRLTASFGAALGVIADLPAAGAGSRLQCLTTERSELAVAAGFVAPEVLPGVLARSFSIPLQDGGTLRCAPRSHVTILRPAGEDSFARITFGAAGFAFADGHTGSGFYEHRTTLLAGGEQSEEP